jgi:hypothetical protein
MQSKRIVLLLLLLAITRTSFADIKSEVAKTIVRVHSEAYATGFFWQNGNTIVTTLHAIKNKNSIDVFIPALRDWRKASVLKVYKRSDLVLLKIDNYISPAYIAARYAARPPVDMKVFTVGYNEGTVAYVDRDFQTGLLQGNTLDDLLPASAKPGIRDLGFPSLSTEIVYLKGQLLHGFSGSPIVDLQGKLVGVADGGLENGAAGISWCIHASSINNLENSIEDFPVINKLKVSALFSGDEPVVETKKYIAYKQYKIQKVKTRNFLQLDRTGSYTTADDIGLGQLLSSFQYAGIDYSSFSFDIYLEETTGATFVVPAGLALKQENGFLVASSATGLFQLKISIQPSINVQATSEQFEFSIMPGLNLYNPYASYWAADSRWTYVMPIPRPDGMLVRRKAFFSNYYQMYIFEALVAKGYTFLGTCVEQYHTINNPAYMQPQIQKELAMFNLANQLSTFTY